MQEHFTNINTFLTGSVLYYILKLTEMVIRNYDKALYLPKSLYEFSGNNKDEKRICKNTEHLVAFTLWSDFQLTSHGVTVQRHIHAVAAAKV